MASQGIAMWFHSSTATEEAELQKSGANGFYLTLNDPSRNTSIDFYAKIWNPPGKPKATLTFIHGLGEHIVRYDPVFSVLAAAPYNIRTFAYDQRGFGRSVHRNVLMKKSDGIVLGDGGGWDIMLEDIYRATHGVFKDKTGPREQGVTHFIMGHSMGAMLVTAYLEKYPPKNDGSNWLDDIEGAILSAPAFQPGFPVPFLKRHVGSFLSKFLGSFNIPTELDANGISRDPQEVEKYKKDPLIHDKGSLRLLAPLLGEGDRIHNNGPVLFPKNIAVLITHGTADRLTNHKASKEFFEKLKKMATETNAKFDGTYREFEGWFHELHNDVGDCRKQITELYGKWIKERA